MNIRPEFLEDLLRMRLSPPPTGNMSDIVATLPPIMKSLPTQRTAETTSGKRQSLYATALALVMLFSQKFPLLTLSLKPIRLISAPKKLLMNTICLRQCRS